tara:strand:- start:736 stop:1008 length:273 start_codon:yes stop_codon:yes gene_type:complete
MKKGDIITVMTLAGEFVGKFESDDNGLELSDPRMVVQGPEGQMGFARGICQTGVENPTEIKFDSYIFVSPSNDDVQAAYRKATSGIELLS